MPRSSIGPNILDRLNCFRPVPLVLVGYKSFWLGTNHFSQVQIRLFWTNFYNLDLSKMIWIQPKGIGSVQNDWYSTKIIWTVQNHVPVLLNWFKLIDGLFRQSNIHHPFFPRNSQKGIKCKNHFFQKV